MLRDILVCCEFKWSFFNSRKSQFIIELLKNKTVNKRKKKDDTASITKTSNLTKLTNSFHMISADNMTRIVVIFSFLKNTCCVDDVKTTL